MYDRTEKRASLIPPRAPKPGGPRSPSPSSAACQRGNASRRATLSSREPGAAWRTRGVKVQPFALAPQRSELDKREASKLDAILATGLRFYIPRLT